MTALAAGVSPQSDDAGHNAREAGRDPARAVAVVDRMMTERPDPVAALIDAACVPFDASHVSGTLERANEIVAEHPDIARASIHAAAVLGDDLAVRQHIVRDRAAATRSGGPRNWDPLTHLCFSRYLALDPTRSDGFVRAATALLDAGASATTGWWEANHRPKPEWESVLYGAAGFRAPTPS
jgi:hypothetical protein